MNNKIQDRADEIKILLAETYQRADSGEMHDNLMYTLNDDMETYEGLMEELERIEKVQKHYSEEIVPLLESDEDEEEEDDDGVVVDNSGGADAG